MRLPPSGLPVILMLLLPLGCADQGPPVAPELRVMDLTLPATVTDLQPGPSASPPADIRVGDPMSITVHYRPVDPTMSIDEETVSRFVFFPDDDDYVDVSVGSHSWRLSLREITLYNDHGVGLDGIEVVAGRKATDPVNVAMVLWDDVSPLDLLRDTSLPEHERGLDLTSVAGSRILLGTWFNGGAFWFIRGELD